MTTTPKQAASDQEEPRLEIPPKPKQLAHLSDEAWARAWELASREPVFYPEHADKFVNLDAPFTLVDEDGNEYVPDEELDEDEGK